MKYVTKQDLAKKLNVSVRSIYKILEAGKLNIEIVYNKKLIKMDRKYQEFVLTYKPKDTSPKKV